MDKSIAKYKIDCTMEIYITYESSDLIQGKIVLKNELTRAGWYWEIDYNWNPDKIEFSDSVYSNQWILLPAQWRATIEDKIWDYVKGQDNEK